MLEDTKLKVNVRRKRTTGFMREHIGSLDYSLRLTNLNHLNHLFSAFKSLNLFTATSRGLHRSMKVNILHVMFRRKYLKTILRNYFPLITQDIKINFTIESIKWY